MKTMKKKSKITILGLILVLLTGCNKQVFDFEYTYDKAICVIGGEKKEIAIKKWNDYDGEQLQIIDEDNNVYLVSSVNCSLIKVEE